MKKKQEEFQDIDWNPIGDMEEEPRVTPPARIVVRELRRSNDGRILVDGDDGNYYLLPKDFDFAGSRVAHLARDDSRLESLYTWDKEIEAMLPDRAALVKLIRRSLYMAGAYQKGDLKKQEVADNALRHAFKFSIAEIEE